MCFPQCLIIFNMTCKLNFILALTVSLNNDLINLTLFNPFLANVPILYPLKTLENQRFFAIFRGYDMRTLPRNGLNSLIKCSCFEYLIGYFFVGHKVTHFWFGGRMFCLIKSFSQLSIVNKRLKQTVKQDGRNFFDVGHRRQFFR